MVDVRLCALHRINIFYDPTTASSLQRIQNKNPHVKISHKSHCLFSIFQKKQDSSSLTSFHRPKTGRATYLGHMELVLVLKIQSRIDHNASQSESKIFSGNSDMARQSFLVLIFASFLLIFSL